MRNNNLALCGAASGSGYGSDEIICTAFQDSASACEPDDLQQLGIAVAFGGLDILGSALVCIPEPHCQLGGWLLIIPSKFIWVKQSTELCQRLYRRWKDKPRR